MALKTLHAVISGKVQGVGFRAFTRKVAKDLELKGFVKNLPDGTVEVIAEGKEEALKKLLEYLEEGPSLSFVTNLKYNYAEYRGAYEDFKIHY